MPGSKKEDMESGAPPLPNENSPLLATSGSNLTQRKKVETRNPSPDSDWMEPDFHPHAVDAYLPNIRGKPFTYKLAGNFSAGITVALINIPLSLSLAVASATIPQAGIITAVWAGILASLFGGSHYNIMGPTGALSGILARYAILWGPQCLPILSLTSGLVMMLVFVMNWDKYVTFLPSAVAHGFTLGVAAIIAGGQLGAAFSLPPIPASSHFLVNLQNNLEELNQADWRAFGVFFSVWISLFAAAKKWPKIPWMIPAAGIGILIGWLSSSGYIFPLRTLRDKYGELSLVLWDPPQWEPQIGQDIGDLVTASLSIAFVGVLESLISGKIADGLTRSTMNQRQEVFAVAIANIGSGAAGGIPATAALARTALNIRSGASSRLAGILNGFFTVLIALCLLPLFGYIPLCVVASLLFQVAAGMIETKHLLHSWHIDRGSFWLTLFVGAMCLIFDPTAAIVLGAVAGLLRFAESVATGYSEVTLTRDLKSGTKLDVGNFDRHHSERQSEGMIIELWRKIFGGAPKTDVSINRSESPAVPTTSSSSTSSSGLTSAVATSTLTEFEQHTLIYRIVGDLTYISSLHHMARLRHMDSSKNLIVSFRYCMYVDLDGLDALEECLGELQANKPERFILLASITKSSMVWGLLNKCTWFQHDFLSKGFVFDLVQDASRYLREQSQSRAGSGRNSPTQQHQSSLDTVSARRLSMDGDLA